MFGEGTLFGSCMRDFETIESDSKKNVDENIEQVIIDNIDRERLAEVCDELGLPEDVVIQAVLANYEFELSQVLLDMGSLDEWLHNNLDASVIRDSIPDPAVEIDREVHQSSPPQEEAKVNEGFNVGDTVQIKDKEGNTTIVPKAIVAKKQEVQDGVISVEVTGSEDEDKQQWYNEDDYQVILLSKNEEKTNEQGELMIASTDSHFENLVDKFSQIEEDEDKNVDESQLKEGQFSWHASDTDEPIYSTEGHQETIFMIDDKGNKWQEDAYDGYGVFGGKDFYILLGEMNGLKLSGAQTQDDEGYYEDRQLAIDLAFKDNASGEDTEGVKYPKLVSDPDVTYEDVPNPRSHENQGWFEEEGEDEHGWNDDDFDESATDEKKAVPVCSKCDKKHWPFKKCEAEDVKEEAKVTDEEEYNELRRLTSYELSMAEESLEKEIGDAAREGDYDFLESATAQLKRVRTVQGEKGKTNEEKEVDEAKTFTCDGCEAELPLSKLSLSKGSKNYCPKCRGKA